MKINHKDFGNHKKGQSKKEKKRVPKPAAKGAKGHEERNREGAFIFPLN
jgi:hypothetical protein